MLAPTQEQVFRVFDDVLPDERREEIYEYLSDPKAVPGWEWGWRSNRKKDALRFWHKHFAGARGSASKLAYDCDEELKTNAPLVWCFWDDLWRVLFPDHRLVRCYANGLQYGSDGTLHTDSDVDWSFTSVYYPHKEWSPDWGGETVFFNKEKTDILGVSYPKPNRLVMFPGTVQHVARGVSRTCPVLRITLMFKTEIRERGASQDGPGTAAS